MNHSAVSVFLLLLNDYDRRQTLEGVQRRHCHVTSDNQAFGQRLIVDDVHVANPLNNLLVLQEAILELILSDLQLPLDIQSGSIVDVIHNLDNLIEQASGRVSPNLCARFQEVVSRNCGFQDIALDANTCLVDNLACGKQLRGHMGKGLVRAIQTALQYVGSVLRHKRRIAELGEQVFLVVSLGSFLDESLRDKLRNSTRVVFLSLYVLRYRITKRRTHIHKDTTLQLTHTRDEDSLTLLVSRRDVRIHTELLSPKRMVSVNQFGSIQNLSDNLTSLYAIPNLVVCTLLKFHILNLLLFTRIESETNR